MATIYPLLLITFIIILIIPNSTLAANFVTSYCSNSSTKYTTKSSFPTNLKTLLNSLTTNAATNPTGFNTASVGKSDTDDVVYGLFLCRGDQDRSGCRDCVATAAREQPERITCPKAKAGLLVYQGCIVRYDGKPISGILDQHQYPKWSFFNPSNATGDKEAFADFVDKTLRKLAAQAANSPVRTGRKYANEKVGLNGSQDYSRYLYGMVQCTPDLSANDCNKCLVGVINQLNKVRQGGRVYCPSCNVRYEIYPFLTTPFNSTPNGNHLPSTLLLIAIPILGATMWSLLCFGAWICLGKRKAMERHNDVDIDEIRTAESLHFDLSTIRASTTNFSSNNKLGEGGFGEVYKGKFESGQEVAIKRLSTTSRQGVAEFRTEVLLVAKLQHKNLVKLLGFCVTSKEKILVYEYLRNSSLDKFLFDSTKNSVLDWQTRLDIMVGIARGLQYLHEDSRLKVIHRDLKTSNILLDEAMNPKISDFGLAKLFGADQTQGDTNKIVGTYGYMAPEYAITGHYSVKSDIYSFGVIILEILSGQKNRFFGGAELEEALLHRAWRLWNEAMPLDLVDPALKNNFSTKEVIKCIHIGLLCVQEDATERPKMTTIVAALSGQSIELPAPMPPHFLCGASNNDKLAESISEYWYTGGETITDIYPRE